MKSQHRLTVTIVFFGFFTLAFLAVVIYFTDRYFIFREHGDNLRESVNLKANLVEQLLLDKTDVIVTLASEKLIVDGSKRSSRIHGTLSPTARDNLLSRNNDTWMRSKENSPFVLTYLNNPVANRLREMQSLFPGFYGELFLTDKYGALIASTGKLTTYKHGHKYWWKGSYAGGEGQAYFDDRGFDESVQGYVVGIVVPVRDGNEIVGILKANINILSLLSRNLVSVGGKYEVEISLIREGGEIVYREGIEPLSQIVSDQLKTFIATEKRNTGILEEQWNGNKYLTAYYYIDVPVGGLESPHASVEESVDHRRGNTNESWIIVASEDFDTIISESNEKLEALLLLGLLIIGVIGIGAWPLAGRMEALIEQRNNELELAIVETERANEAKSVFLASMSHELRTPLNAILGYARILQSDQSLKSDTIEKLSIVERSGNHLLTLINDILDLSKIEAGKVEITPSEINMQSLFNDIVSIFEMRARQKGLDFKYERRFSSLLQEPAGLPLYIFADEKRIRQVMYNLLSNAIKFTEKGYIILRLTYFPESVLVDVEDSGRGIKSDDMESIFDPFHQVGDQQDQEGTGLGLSISQRLVNLMGGKLIVESNQGLGSVFSFELPLKIVNYTKNYGDSNTYWDLSLKVRGYEGERKKVLVADDLRANRMVVADLLEPLGFDIIQACDGLEAVDMARSEKPDIILMDMRMPVLNGFEATKKIRAIPELSQCVIFAFSASVFKEQKQQAVEAGCVAFLSKPIDTEELYIYFEKHCNIKWIESKDEPEKEQIQFTWPHPDVLKELSILVKSGEIKSIRERINLLRKEDPELTEFCEHIDSLVTKFKLKELSKFLEGTDLGG